MGKAPLSSFVPALRERDGDGCKLCPLPIDFSLGMNDPWAVSVDHIQPKAAGGLTVLPNLQLAHRYCNWKKGALWEGRDWSLKPYAVSWRRLNPPKKKRKPDPWDDWSASRQVPGGRVLPGSLLIGDEPVMPCG